MMPDRELQNRVLEALDRHAGVPAATLGVTASHGVIRLMGEVATLQERWAAERVTEEVPEVRAVANDLEVSWRQKTARTNSIIAGEIAKALSGTVPSGLVKAAVDDGWVTLFGMVDSESQRYAADRVVRHIDGVTGVFNAVTVKHPAAPSPRISSERELIRA